MQTTLNLDELLQINPKADLTKLHKLIDKKEDFEHKQNELKEIYKEQCNKFIRAKNVWEEECKELIIMLISTLMKIKDNELKINITVFDGYVIELVYAQNKENYARWSYLVDYNKTEDKLIFATNILNEPDIESFKSLVNYKYSNRLRNNIMKINWKSMIRTFEKNKPWYKDYVTVNFYKKTLENYDKEIFWEYINICSNANALFECIDNDNYITYYYVDNIDSTTVTITPLTINKIAVDYSDVEVTPKPYATTQISKDYFYKIAFINTNKQIYAYKLVSD